MKKLLGILALISIVLMTVGCPQSEVPPSPSPSTYFVRFESMGGTLVQSIEVLSGEKVVKPTDPTRTGYSFVGWYKESSFINAWNFENDTVTNNIILYAKWGVPTINLELGTYQGTTFTNVKIFFNSDTFKYLENDLEIASGTWSQGTGDGKNSLTLTYTTGGEGLPTTGEIFSEKGFSLSISNGNMIFEKEKITSLDAPIIDATYNDDDTVDITLTALDGAQIYYNTSGLDYPFDIDNINYPWIEYTSPFTEYISEATREIKVVAVKDGVVSAESMEKFKLFNSVRTPTITHTEYDKNGDLTITLTSEEGASMYYWFASDIFADIPDFSKDAWTLYENPFTLNIKKSLNNNEYNVELTCIAVKDGLTNSFEEDITFSTKDSYVTPSIQGNSDEAGKYKLTISDNDYGVGDEIIYWATSDIPFSLDTWTLFDDSQLSIIDCTQGDVTVRAIITGDSRLNSDIATYTFAKPEKTQKPTAVTKAGIMDANGVQTVKIEIAEYVNAVTYYTLSDSNYSQGNSYWIEYEGPFGVSLKEDSITVKAVTVRENYFPSDETILSLDKALVTQAPVITSGVNSFTITAIEGATIQYSLNATDTWTNCENNVTMNVFPAHDGTTVRVKAHIEGSLWSEVVTRTYNTVGDETIPLTYIHDGDFRRAIDGYAPVTAYMTDYYIGETEITQKQWWDVMGQWPAKGGNFDSSSSKPIFNVTWLESIKFCNALSVKDGYDPYYYVYSYRWGTDNNGWNEGFYFTKGNVVDNNTVLAANELVMVLGDDKNQRGYRLPTEAEWHYAALGRIALDNDHKWIGTKYPGTDDETYLEYYAWYSQNASAAKDVKTRQQEVAGLYDMGGNVAEWCFDYDSGFYCTRNDDHPIADYFTGKNFYPNRVYRGGAYTDDADDSRVAARRSALPETAEENIGFRIAKFAY